MKTPKVSILLPTMRVGGLDIVTSGLKNQTFKDFELVIADGLYDRRKEVVAEKTRDLPFPVLHVPIENENPFPLNAFSRYANSAIANSAGDLALFITDYTWLPPEAVERHVDFNRTSEPRTGLMSPHQYTVLPPLHKTFPSYEKEQIQNYVDDLNAGRLSEVMWSIFDKEFDVDPRSLPIDPIMGNADPKLVHAPGPIAPYYFHGKNESCSMDLLLSINGWDEDLDGTHCYQDSDLSDRLHMKVGVRWHCDPTCVAFIVNPRHVFPHPVRVRDIDSNYHIYNNKKSKGFPILPNSWDVKKRRHENLSRRP